MIDTFILECTSYPTVLAAGQCCVCLHSPAPLVNSHQNNVFDGRNGDGRPIIRGAIITLQKGGLGRAGL